MSPNRASKNSPTLGQAARRRLMRWYEQNSRALPWRTADSEGGEPYWVLLSEIMLQQTQVAVVVPRFLQFIERFPSIDQLASSDEQEVLEEWSGLGYYRRARSLHQTAIAVADRGGFPRTAKELIDLPGIGEYTAAAVASIAFGEPSPVLDGNVERVTARLLVAKGNPKHKRTRERLRAASSALFDPLRPGASNQAMMELGALVCHKRSPDCGICPLRVECLASKYGLQEQYPQTSSKRARRKRLWPQSVQLRRGARGPQLRLERRSSTASVLPGRWQLPSLGSDPSAKVTSTSLKTRSIADEVDEIGRFNHSITTTDYEVVLIASEGPDAKSIGEPTTPSPSDREPERWLDLVDFDALGRWRGRDPLPTSALLHKAVVVIRDDLARGSKEDA